VPPAGRAEVKRLRLAAFFAQQISVRRAQGDRVAEQHAFRRMPRAARVPTTARRTRHAARQEFVIADLDRALAFNDAVDRCVGAAIGAALKPAGRYCMNVAMPAWASRRGGFT